MQFNIEKLLFFDVETVSQYEELDQLPEEELKLWSLYYDTFKERVTDKSKLPNPPSHLTKKEVYRQTAALFPEFGKVVCVSLGFATKEGKIKLQSFYGKDEVDILKKVRDIFNKVDSMGFILCGQNIKNFDIPFLAKRYVINGLKIPTIFPNHDTKPWEMKILDTKEVWSFNGKYGLSSLDLICMSLQIDSPKNGDIKGSNVSVNFWVDNYKEIKDYCEKDVKALIDIITKLNLLK